MRIACKKIFHDQRPLFLFLLGLPTSAGEGDDGFGRRRPSACRSHALEGSRWPNRYIPHEYGFSNWCPPFMQCKKTHYTLDNSVLYIGAYMGTGSEGRLSCYGDLGVDEAPTQKSWSCWACGYHLTGKNRVARECVTPSEVFQQRLTQHNINRWVGKWNEGGMEGFFYK